MSNAVFPTLAGLMWDRERTPMFSTLIQESVSGKRTAQSLWAGPRWKWTLSYDCLRDDVAHNELKSLAGFFLARGGRADTFLYNDPYDNAVTGQILGTGNGANQYFTVGRSFGGYFEPLRSTEARSAIVPFVDGVQLTTGFSWVGTTLTITTPPANGKIVTANIAYYWRCRFTEDSATFKNFMYLLWECQKIEFDTEF